MAGCARLRLAVAGCAWLAVAGCTKRTENQCFVRKQQRKPKRKQCIGHESRERPQRYSGAVSVLFLFCVRGVGSPRRSVLRFVVMPREGRVLFCVLFCFKRSTPTAYVIVFVLFFNEAKQERKQRCGPLLGMGKTYNNTKTVSSQVEPRRS